MQRSGSTEIVGVSLEFQTDGGRGYDMILKSMPIAVSDRRVPRLKGHPHLRIGVA